MILVGANGLSYEEAATICEVEIGTIKSRLTRARSKLVELLALDETVEPAAPEEGRLSGYYRPPMCGNAALTAPTSS